MAKSLEQHCNGNVADLKPLSFGLLNEKISNENKQENSKQRITLEAEQPQSNEECLETVASKSVAADDSISICTEYEKDVNTLISVTIKGNEIKVKNYNNQTPTSSVLKQEEPGKDELFCLKEGYKLRKKIGEGAYSKVKAAEVLPEKIDNDRKIAKLVDKNGHNLVAVKILNKEKAPSDYTTKFIGREIQALHRIRGHPNVVEIYDVFETSEFLFIITELCQKGDLFHYINAHTEAGHSGLTEAQARGFFIQICEGMRYCHERGVVHRDFKCENVLICEDEKTVKISDFGFACTVPNKRLMLSTPCGSYSYAAPEVLFGKSYDPFLGDLWCLGVVLFCMLNGTTPYGHVQLSMLANHMKSQRLQFQRISQESKLLIRSLLQYDPRKRPRIAQILNSPWVNKEKVNIVERLYTPAVIDRSHLTDMVTKFNLPSVATVTQSTEHRQCINFSRISFSNGSESVSLKSRQPNRERDRYLQVRPVLRRTRMSVVEFKERLGLNINQSRPMAEILKSIISGGIKTNTGSGDDSMEQKIPELPGNLSNMHGDSNQHMIEYLAEMWVDIDRDRVTTVTDQTTCTNSDHGNNNALSQAGVKPSTAPAAIAGPMDEKANENSDPQTPLQRDTDAMNVVDGTQTHRALDISDGAQTHRSMDITDSAQAHEESLKQETQDEIPAVEDQVPEQQNFVNQPEGLHPPPGRDCCCCGGQATYLDDDNGTEVSFCTCSNPDTLHTGSTYTVHVPQPQDECFEDSSLLPVKSQELYNTPEPTNRLMNTPVDGKIWNPPPPSWKEMANHYKNRKPSLTGIDLEQHRAERLLSRARMRNAKLLQQQQGTADENMPSSTPGADVLREHSQLLPNIDKHSPNRNLYLRPNKLKRPLSPSHHQSSYKMNVASVKMSVLKTSQSNSDHSQLSSETCQTKQCFALLTNQMAYKILSESKLDRNKDAGAGKTHRGRPAAAIKIKSRNDNNSRMAKSSNHFINQLDPTYYNHHQQHHAALLSREEGSILKFTSSPGSVVEQLSARDNISEMGSNRDRLTHVSNKTYVVTPLNASNDIDRGYAVPHIDETVAASPPDNDVSPEDHDQQTVLMTDYDLAKPKQEVVLGNQEVILGNQDVICGNQEVILGNVATTVQQDKYHGDEIIKDQSNKENQHYEQLQKTDLITDTQEELQNNLDLEGHREHMLEDETEFDHELIESELQQDGLDSPFEHVPLEPELQQDGLYDYNGDETDIDLKKHDSGDSLRSSIEDDELTMVADMDEDENISPDKSIPLVTPVTPPEVKHLVSPVRLDAKSVSPMLNERLYFLRPRKTESERSHVATDDQIYERHARATPIKDKYLSEQVSNEIKKSKKLISKKGANLTNNLVTNSGYTMGHFQRSPRKNDRKFQSNRTHNSKRNGKDEHDINRDNKSLPVLQVHKSRVAKPLIYEEITRGRLMYRSPSPRRSQRPRSRSPFPNPLSNPTLWQTQPETMQLGDDGIRSTPSVTCPMLPQKIQNVKEVTKRRFRQKTPDIDIYTISEDKIKSMNEKNSIFPPVQNLMFEEDKIRARKCLMGALQKQY